MVLRTYLLDQPSNLSLGLVDELRLRLHLLGEILDLLDLIVEDLICLVNRDPLQESNTSGALVESRGC